jgi:hypothetical protein
LAGGVVRILKACVTPDHLVQTDRECSVPQGMPPHRDMIFASVFKFLLEIGFFGIRFVQRAVLNKFPLSICEIIQIKKSGFNPFLLFF